MSVKFLLPFKVTFSQFLRIRLWTILGVGGGDIIWLPTCAIYFVLVKNHLEGFPGGAVVENLAANAGDTGSSPGLGRSHMPRSN